MAAIVAILAMFGGGNDATNFNTGADGESYGPQTLIPEHDPDLAPAPYHLIEAAPTVPAAAIATITAAAVSESHDPGCPAVIVSTFGDMAGEACRVSFCETAGTWNPLSHNTDGEDSRGLFQLNVGWSGPSGPHGWASWFGVHPDAFFDAETNTRAALAIYEYSGGWGPWTCKP